GGGQHDPIEAPQVEPPAPATEQSDLVAKHGVLELQGMDGRTATEPAQGAAQEQIDEEQHRRILRRSSSRCESAISVPHTPTIPCTGPAWISRSSRPPTSGGGVPSSGTRCWWTASCSAPCSRRSSSPCRCPRGE